VLVDYSSKLILYAKNVSSVCAAQTGSIKLDIDIVLRSALIYAALCVSAFHFVLCLVCGIEYSVWLASCNETFCKVFRLLLLVICNLVSLALAECNWYYRNGMHVLCCLATK
jgi:hypothetical protein